HGRRSPRSEPSRPRGSATFFCPSVPSTPRDCRQESAMAACSEEVFQAHVEKVTIGKAADRVGAAAREPAERPLDPDLVTKLCRGDGAQECGAVVGIVDGKEARLVLLTRERKIRGGDE